MANEAGFSTGVNGARGLQRRKRYQDPRGPLRLLSHGFAGNSVRTSSLRMCKFFVMRGIDQEFNALSIPAVPIQNPVFSSKMISFF